MYIEASSPAKPGWKARLVSPTLDVQRRCMKFSYHMYGGTMGKCETGYKSVERLGTVFT